MQTTPGLPHMDICMSGKPMSTTQLDETEEPFIFTTIRYDPALELSAENTAVSCNEPCPFYMLENHYTRLQVAKWSLASWAKESSCGIHGSTERERQAIKGPSSPAELLQGLRNAVDVWKKSHLTESADISLRIKFRLYMNGKIRTEIFDPIPRVPLEILFPDGFGEPDKYQNTTWSVFLDTMPTEPTESTMIKTYDRRAYDRARANVGIASFADLKEVLLHRSDSKIFDGSLSTPYVFRHGKWITPTASDGGQQGVTRRWALSRRLAIEGTVQSDALEIGEVILMSNAVKGFFPAVFRGTPSQIPT